MGNDRSQTETLLRYELSECGTNHDKGRLFINEEGAKVCGILTADNYNIDQAEQLVRFANLGAELSDLANEVVRNQGGISNREAYYRFYDRCNKLLEDALTEMVCEQRNGHIKSIIRCMCACHEPTGTLHEIPCCEGQCVKCGRWYKLGLVRHIAKCPGVLVQ